MSRPGIPGVCQSFSVCLFVCNCDVKRSAHLVLRQPCRSSGISVSRRPCSPHKGRGLLHSRCSAGEPEAIDVQPIGLISFHHRSRHLALVCTAIRSRSTSITLWIISSLNTAEWSFAMAHSVCSVRRRCDSAECGCSVNFVFQSWTCGAPHDVCCSTAVRRISERTT